MGCHGRLHCTAVPLPWKLSYAPCQQVLCFPPSVSFSVSHPSPSPPSPFPLPLTSNSSNCRGLSEERGRRRLNGEVKVAGGQSCWETQMSRETTFVRRGGKKPTVWTLEGLTLATKAADGVAAKPQRSINTHTLPAAHANISTSVLDARVNTNKQANKQRRPSLVAAAPLEPSAGAAATPLLCCLFVGEGVCAVVKVEGKHSGFSRDVLTCRECPSASSWTCCLRAQLGSQRRRPLEASAAARRRHTRTHQ